MALLPALYNRQEVFGMNKQWLATLQESILLIVWDIHGLFKATQIHTTLNFSRQEHTYIRRLVSGIRTRHSLQI